MGGGDDDVEELWNFDELDELEAQQSGSDEEGGKANVPLSQLLRKDEEEDDDEESEASSDKDEAAAPEPVRPAAAEAAAPTAAAEGAEPGAGLAAGGGLREKLDFLFGPGDSESDEDDEDEEEDEDDEDWMKGEAATAGGEAPAPAAPTRTRKEKGKEKEVFEDPRKKLTNLEVDRLRNEDAPLKERVRQRLTRLAEARAKGKVPGPPGPPPPPPEGEAGKKRSSAASAALAEQPLPFGAPATRATMREARKERGGRMHDNIELREKGAANGEPVSHECRGVRSEGLPGVPAPVLLRRAVRRAGAATAGFGRPSILAMAMAEAQEATARVAARQAEEDNFCAHCRSPLDHPMRCSQCLEVCYCSRECQRQDWKTHKRHCGRKGEPAIPVSSRPSGARLSGTRVANAVAEIESRSQQDDAPDLQGQEEEAERRRQLEERERLEEQRRERLEEERRRAEEARQEKARLERARTAALRQQRMEEARKKAEKQRQEKEQERAREEEEARRLQEEAMQAAREMEDAARKKVEMAAYEDYLLAQVRQQELLEGGAQQQRPAPTPQPVPAPMPAKEPPVASALQTRFATANAYNAYKRHQPNLGQRLAALGMEGF